MLTFKWAAHEPQVADQADQQHPDLLVRYRFITKLSSDKVSCGSQKPMSDFVSL